MMETAMFHKQFAAHGCAQNFSGSASSYPIPLRRRETTCEPDFLSKLSRISGRRQIPSREFSE